MYFAIKHIHLTCIALSLVLFLLRGGLALFCPEKLEKRWLKIVPHIIDTALLVSALTLAVMIEQYPFVHHWLTAKVIALVVYIGLGTIAIKRGKTKAIQATSLAGALLAFIYIAAVAVSKSPMPWG
ncbi:SirB2 family protein [Neptuniibacter sp. SY11_33]|uniref:SirB2 family protein n=1 Tax=Neptuniibacter sp. SY11_33 TaxID=3398215 RepID=UPI0039F4681A